MKAAAARAQRERQSESSLSVVLSRLERAVKVAEARHTSRRQQQQQRQRHCTGGSSQTGGSTALFAAPEAARSFARLSRLCVLLERVCVCSLLTILLALCQAHNARSNSQLSHTTQPPPQRRRRLRTKTTSLSLQVQASAAAALAAETSCRNDCARCMREQTCVCARYETTPTTITSTTILPISF